MKKLNAVGKFILGLFTCASSLYTTFAGIHDLFPSIPSWAMLVIQIGAFFVGIFLVACAVIDLYTDIKKIREYRKSVKPHELAYQSDEFFKFFADWYHQPGELSIICGNLEWITDGNNLSVQNELLTKSKMKKLTILTSEAGARSPIIKAMYQVGAKVRIAPNKILAAYTFSCLSVMDDPAGKIIFRDKLKSASNGGEDQTANHSEKIIFEEVANIHIMKLVTALLEGEEDIMRPEPKNNPASDVPAADLNSEGSEREISCWDINVNIRKQDLEQGTDVTYVQVIKPWVIGKALLFSTKESRILDTGCGCGYLTNALYEAGRPLLQGVDLSSLSIQCARKQYPHIPFICQDIYAYSSPETFDLCLAVMTLNNLPDLDRYFATAHRSLIKGGKVLGIIPHPCFWPTSHLNGREYSYFLERPYQYQFSTKGRKDYSAEITYYHRTVETYIRSILENGFRILCWEELLDSSNQSVPDILGFVLEKS